MKRGVVIITVYKTASLRIAVDDDIRFFRPITNAAARSYLLAFRYFYTVHIEHGNIGNLEVLIATYKFDVAGRRSTFFLFLSFPFCLSCFCGSLSLEFFCLFFCEGSCFLGSLSLAFCRFFCLSGDAKFFCGCCFGSLSLALCGFFCFS